MPQLYFVRHAQASIGHENYDQLSLLGHEQSEVLGRWWQSHGIQISHVWSGSMVRHQQTLAGIQKHAAMPTVNALQGLNEYDFKAVISAYMEKFPSDENVKQGLWLPLLKSAIVSWARDEISAPTLETWADFNIRVSGALKQIMQTALAAQQDALIVTSAGVMALVAQRALGCEDSGLIGLNVALKNSAICEYRLSKSGLSLQSFNALPHLADPAHKLLHTRV